MLLHQQERSLHRLAEDLDQSSMEADPNDSETIHLYRHEARMARIQRAKILQRQKTIRSTKEATAVEAVMPKPDESVPNWDSKEMKTFFGKQCATANEALTAFKHHFTRIPGNSETMYKALATALPGEARETWYKLTAQHSSIHQAVKQMASMYMVKKTAQESARELQAHKWDTETSFRNFMAKWEILYFEAHGNGVNPHMERPTVKESNKQQVIMSNLPENMRNKLDEAIWNDRATGRIWNSTDMVKWVNSQTKATTPKATPKTEVVAVNVMRASSPSPHRGQRDDRGRSRDRRYHHGTQDGAVRKPSRDSRSLSQESKRKAAQYVTDLISQKRYGTSTREREQPMDTSEPYHQNKSSNGYNSYNNQSGQSYHRTQQQHSRSDSNRRRSPGGSYNSHSYNRSNTPSGSYNNSSYSRGQASSAPSGNGAYDRSRRPSGPKGGESRGMSPNRSYTIGYDMDRTPNGWKEGAYTTTYGRDGNVMERGRSRGRTPNGSRGPSAQRPSRPGSQSRSNSQRRNSYSNGSYKAAAVKQASAPTDMSNCVLEANAKLHVNSDKGNPKPESSYNKGYSNNYYRGATNN